MHRHSDSIVQTARVLLLLPVLIIPVTAAPSDQFEQSVAPLLIKRCVECHEGPTASGNLRLTSAEGLRAGGDSGSVIFPGDPKRSLLLDRVRGGEMPPAKQGRPQRLPDEEIAILEAWVAGGAEWPESRTLHLFERSNGVRAGYDWWSLQPIERPAVPDPRSSGASSHPVDRFIQDRLAEAGFAQAPAADRRTLLRRMHFVLTGLPPTADELDRFARDTSATAVADRIDELLASPHYGERQARHWMDVVRYADTSGYERDQEKPFAWKYRDWLVNAFNSDLPYDQFVMQQIAGDELPDRSEQTVIATGFLRLGTWNDEPNDPEDYLYDRMEDLVHATSSAFLGMTVKCARCHTHKFDPITQEDYYRMASAFRAGPIAQRDRDLLGGPSSAELGFNEVLGWTDLGPDPPPLRVLQNGERHHPLQEVIPASLSMIPALERTFAPAASAARTSQRRLQLAEWLTDPDHPLTARVMVNRIWLNDFGQGLVRSPNNFGFLSDPPTHPELLDWLADEFRSSGWSVKRIHRLLLTSESWQQASVHPSAMLVAQQDAGNRLWWRAERRRLDAESLRDAMLAATGELDLRRGGPAFRTSIDAEALEGLSMKDAAWQPSPPEEQFRRSLYSFMKRGLLPPMMTTFDLCDPTLPCGQRDSTTVPTQALALMNSHFVHERSRRLARDVVAEMPDPGETVQRLFRQVLGRGADLDEHALAQEHLTVQAERFAAAQSLPEGWSPAELAAASLVQVLLSSNEFLYID